MCAAQYIICTHLVFTLSLSQKTTLTVLSSGEWSMEHHTNRQTLLLQFVSSTDEPCRKTVAVQYSAAAGGDLSALKTNIALFTRIQFRHFTKEECSILFHFALKCTMTPYLCTVPALFLLVVPYFCQQCSQLLRSHAPETP